MLINKFINIFNYNNSANSNSPHKTVKNNLNNNNLKWGNNKPPKFNLFKFIIFFIKKE